LFNCRLDYAVIYNVILKLHNYNEIKYKIKIIILKLFTLIKEQLTWSQFKHWLVSLKTSWIFRKQLLLPVAAGQLTSWYIRIVMVDNDSINWFVYKTSLLLFTHGEKGMALEINFY
jgi:hypothetical protein